jgi:hypothetical protein
VGMISLAYVSHASHEMTDDELIAILQVARRTNASLDISGMLLYRDGFFVQVLEGEADKVDPLYEKISRDPRHKNIIMIYRAPITERIFAKWTMGFNRLPESINIDGYDRFLDGSDPDFFTNKPSRAKQLLDSFREHSFF